MPESVNSRLAALWPRDCLFCGLVSGARASCPGCRSDLVWVANPCRDCGKPLPATRTRCDDCEQQGSPLNGVTRSALIYTYPIDRIIAAAKYRDRLDCAAELGEILADYLGALNEPFHRPELVVPVPLHRRRLAMRGYNQATEIARPVAARFDLRLFEQGCRRHRHTAEQTRLSGAARQQNLTGAFTAAPAVQGKHVAIIDDVLTTGATVKAVGLALRSAGASSIQIWTVARTAN